MVGVWSAVFSFGPALGIDSQLVGGSPFGTQGTFVDRAVIITLDIDDLAIGDCHDLPATDGAVCANAGDLFSLLDAFCFYLGLKATQINSKTNQVCHDRTTQSTGRELEERAPR